MSWRSVTLGDLIDNFSIRAKDFGGGENLPFYGVSNEDGLTISKYAAEEKADEYKIIEKGCFAYNPYRVNVGSIALMTDEKRGLISPAYVVFKPKPKSIIPKLLLKFLKSSEGLRQIKQHARGTVRQALRFEDLCKIELTIPNFEQQEVLYKRISETEREGRVLSIELMHQLDLVLQLRQAFLREAMQGKLVVQDPNDEPARELLNRINAEKEKLIKEGKFKRQKEFPTIKPDEIPFEIPKNWVWSRLAEICSIITDGTHKTPDYKLLGVPFISAQNLSFNQVDFNNVKYISESEYSLYFSNKLLQKGDVLLAKSGTLGIAAVFPTNERYAFYESIALIRSKVFPAFLSYFLNFNSFRFIKESQKGIGVKHLHLIDIRNFTIPVPPISEQQRIVTKLEQLMQYCNELEKNIKQGQNQNEQLLQQVLREALRPKEYNQKSELSLAEEV